MRYKVDVIGSKNTFRGYIHNIPLCKCKTSAERCDVSELLVSLIVPH